MSFDPENRLEQALKRALSEPAVRPEFYRLLLESKLFVIGQIAGQAEADKDQSAGANERMMIATLAYQGRDYHPIFSAHSRLQAFAREEVQHLTITGRMLFEATRGAHFLLNPGSECGKELRANEIANVLDSPTYQPTRIKVSQPKVYPQELVDGLKNLFGRTPDVVAAHLIEIAVEGQDEPPHPLIGVETEGDWTMLSQAMGEVMKASPLDTVVDMLPIDRAEPTGIMQALLQTPPFYARPTKTNAP